MHLSFTPTPFVKSIQRHFDSKFILYTPNIYSHYKLLIPNSFQYVTSPISNKYLTTNNINDNNSIHGRYKYIFYVLNIYNSLGNVLSSFDDVTKEKKTLKTNVLISSRLALLFTNTLMNRKTLPDRLFVCYISQMCYMFILI